MKLAELKNGKLKVKEFKNIPELGIYSIGENINEDLLNSKGYYCLSDNPIYDSVMQHLGDYEIKNGKAIRTIVDKEFGTIEEEKDKKIKQLNTAYRQKISEAVYPWQEKASFGEIIPDEIKQIRLDIISECHSKELAIKGLTELREVLTYEL